MSAQKIATPYLTVVNIDRDKLVICDTQSSTTPVFNFPPDTIRDLEIINREGLTTALKKFVEDHKLVPSQLILVLSPNVYFDKNLSNISLLDRENEMELFLETIPFASISSKVFKIGGIYKLVAINRDLYESIKSVFEQLNFSVSAVVPSFIVNTFGVKDTFDIEACRLILKKSDYVIQNNFLTQIDHTSFSKEPRSYLNRHPAVVALFLAPAVIFLGFVAYSTLKKPTQIPARINTETAPVVNNPLPTLLPPASPSATISPANIKIQILNGSGIPGLASKVQKQIMELGFTDVSLGNSASASATTFIVFSPSVPQPYRDSVVFEGNELFSDVSIQENSGTTADILIITGKLK